MSCAVVATTEAHFESLHRALDVVAREHRFLALMQAPPLEKSLAFYRGVIDSGFPHFVALDGEKVVGWCDVSPVFGHSRAHIGLLGIALLPEARHRGLGAQLLQAAIDKSWARGLTRIELSVRADNLNAKALYERFGFVHEGLQRRASLVGGIYHDAHAMALLR
ncbi:GNAT family N-acetyltransferase [Variovorax sp. J22G73]|jgi:putative acetyltransferase|uniref:GNAT family N-acetyltransferase n=1 Tax=unclassified Variovorax TaxID=663243 RepID=UPI000D5EC928|nr:MULTISPECIES: GNAT family N-acetyltransferase [unclassified Variovorax]MDM0004224.1 GNAT family N-acetyltransferase [Variovorax sp. J22R203]MDM0096110.1 GNAT family N-acetyltransferase [Variovorax sp. J22G73]